MVPIAKTSRFTSKSDLTLYCVGDLHWGDPSCDRDKFVEDLKTIKASDPKTTRVLLMGDMIENATKRSVGAAMYEQLYSPQKQLDHVSSLLETFSMDEYVVGVLTGNHEERAWKDSGIDVSKILADRLKVPYFRYGAMLRLVAGNNGYNVYATHGAGGATTASGRLNTLQKLRTIATADIYLMGHLHTTEHIELNVLEYDTRKKSSVIKPIYFSYTGSYLEWANSYAQMKTYSINESPGMQTLTLKADEWGVIPG